MFDYEKQIKCKGLNIGRERCTWEGQLKDCVEKEVNSPRSAWIALAGREGWEWFCPSCGMMIDSYYTRMS